MRSMTIALNDIKQVLFKYNFYTYRDKNMSSKNIDKQRKNLKQSPAKADLELTRDTDNKKMIWLIPSVLMGIIVIGISLAIAFPPTWEWAGIGTSSQKSLETVEMINGKVRKTTTTTKFDSAKTLWDWMSLLLAPLTLFIVGFGFQSSQEKIREAKEKSEKFKIEKAQRADATEAYFDRVSGILLEKDLLNIEENNPFLKAALNVIRAKTLSVLTRIQDDKDYLRESVIIFLYSAQFLTEGKLHISLSESCILNADFQGVDLSKADLSETDLSEANFSLAKLNYTNFSKTDLQNSIFTFAELIKSNFSESELSESNLSFADLTKANLSKANLSEANLSETILVGANFSNATLDKAKFEKANTNIELKGVIPEDELVNFKGASLTNAHLTKANFLEANFEGANLSGANLREVNFQRANLSGANLRGADLRGANLYDTNLIGADLIGANLENAELIYTKIFNADLTEANLEYADLTGFTKDNITGTKFNGTKFRDNKWISSETKEYIKSVGGKFRDS
jgi:uncharacterized protein YjbI with pentapeptide repeats